MSTSTVRPQGDNLPINSRVAVARPPERPLAGQGLTAPLIVVPGAAPDEAGLFNPWSPASLKGWAGSVALHALLLVCLALWYFAPPVHRPIVFDSRLAGSPSGVPDGLMLAGGLNAASLDEAERSVEAAAPEPLLELTPAPLEPALPPGRAVRPGARERGGAPNDNPGAGDGDGFGLARFGEGGEMIRGVAVKVGDPQFTLIWDTDADLDLHVVEPGGKEIYWEEPKGTQGGELDVDNTKGLGPENIYWLVESDGAGSAKVKGPGPSGVYRWWVVYWGGFGGIPKPTHWKVRIKHDGKVTVIHGKFRALNERSRIYTLKVEAPRAALRSDPPLPLESP